MQERMRFVVRLLAWICLSLMCGRPVAESTHNHLNQARIRCVLHLRGGSQHCAHSQLQLWPADFEAIGLLQEKQLSRRSGFSVSTWAFVASCRLGIPRNIENFRRGEPCRIPIFHDFVQETHASFLTSS